MADTHVISALIERRRRLAGERQSLRTKANRIQDSIAAIDKTIKQFDPDIRPNTLAPIIFRERNRYFPPGQGSRLVVDVLRDAGGPLALPEISTQVAERAGIDLDSVDINAYRLAVHNVLKGLVRRGRVDAVEGRQAWIVAQ